MLGKMSIQEISEKLSEIGGWEMEKDMIKKTFKFKDFREAMDFVTEVAILAEEVDHHPNILIEYNSVTLTLSTHSAGGITMKDFDLAKEIEITLNV